LNWGLLKGGFNTISLPALGSGLAWSTLKLYSNGSITAVNADLIPGDINHDLKVDVADITAIMGALSDISGYEAARGLSDLQLQQVADVNGDGSVDNRDLQVLLNFVAETDGTGAGSITAVPEPPSWLLVTVSIALVLRRAPIRRERAVVPAR